MLTTGSRKLLGLGLLLALIVGIAPAAFGENEGYGPGRVGLSILAGRDHEDVGTGGIWNSRDKLHIQLDPAEGWRIKGYKVDLGQGPDYSPPLTTTGNPKIGHFDYKEEFEFPYMSEVSDDGNAYRRTLVLDLEEDLGVQWGSPYADLRDLGVAIFVELVHESDVSELCEWTGAWVVPELVTWVVEETVEAADSDVVVDGEAIVAVAETGELIEEAFVKVDKTKKGRVHKQEHKNAQRNWEVEEAEEIIAFDGGRWGWWFRYEIAHPRTGHFIDSPVAGVMLETPTYEGLTDETASFDYFPGETVDVYLGSILLGSTVADHKISPLDFFPVGDTEDHRVINMARLLQSLDVDGDAQGSITILPEAVTAFETAMEYYGLTELDFTDDAQIDNVIARTVEVAATLDPPQYLTQVGYDDAQGHLEDTLNNVMFRKNISKTPDEASTKAKMNIAPMWFPARRANDDLLTDIGEAIEYYDENGDLIRTATEAKPIIVTYTDDDPVTGGADVWAAVSRDDGETWKRKNLSRTGDLSSFTGADGEVYYGSVKKPVFSVQGNKIMVAWGSKYAKGGKPRYAIDVEDDYTYDDAYAVDDIWGVGGPQRSHDYVEDGFPEVGEVPFQALWTCRGLILSAKDLTVAPWNDGEHFVGEIVWFKPERLTSGRRDVNQIFLAVAGNAGFAMVWQEDPNGVQPGKAVGPGPGWGGATTSHKTDIWYSYILWGNHSKVDQNFVPGSDVDHPFDWESNRPKSLVPWELPVRLSDNEVINTKNLGIDAATEESITYSAENLTRCVKFEGGKTIVERDSMEEADYHVLPDLESDLLAIDHFANMNCTSCHVPTGLDPMGVAPTQGSVIPLQVIDAENNDYLGGFTNGDCVSCHYSNIVPRDRLIAVTPGLDEDAKCAECEAKGGIWKLEIEAYYPYEPYPYVRNTDDDADGTHNYALAVEGLLADPPEFYTFTNYSGAETSVAITSDGRLLDGDTGASRGNIFIQPYWTGDVKPDGSPVISAWTIITYEETKGAGAGPPEETGSGDEDGGGNSDAYVPEEGKNVIYHSFDFQNPDVVAAGRIVNRPEFIDADGDNFADPDELVYLVDDSGAQILDYLDRPQLAYENARRGRFMPQGIGAFGTSRTALVMVHKQGEEGSGRPSDILLRRWEYPATAKKVPFKNAAGNAIAFTIQDKTTGETINPYSPDCLVGTWVEDATVSQGGYYADGVQNMSSVTPTVTTPSTGDPDQEDAYGAVKVVEWVQTIDNLNDPTGYRELPDGAPAGLFLGNPYDDARAHRGSLRGDKVTCGFSYTPNWAAARNGHDHFDFYIRRSWDGGKTWIAAADGDGVEHCRTWIYPASTDGIVTDAAETPTPGTKVEECNFYGPGEFEAMRNLSALPNHKESVIEPRIVAVPGTIKVNGAWTGLPEDKQDSDVFYVAYGTSTNPIKDPITGEQEEPTPADLYWSVTTDMGESYYLDTWYVNGEPGDGSEYSTGDEVTGWPWMAKGDQEQGEVQLRETPDGSRFYASWLDEGEDGSDIVFRRILPPTFDANWAGGVIPADATAVEVEEEASMEDYSGDSGGE